MTAISFEGVTLRRTSHGVARTILDGIDWEAGEGEHWGIAGPNGAGKTTLLRIASAQMRPSAGTARVLGEQLGRTRMPELRRRIGLVEPSFARRFYPDQRGIDIVLSGLTGSVLLVDELSAAQIAHAGELLEAVGVGGLATRTFASCSEGERARILLARALITDAPLLVLDEPAAGLDLGGRELLLEAFERAVGDRPGLTTLTVTHHIEELPPSTTHALLLADGRVVGAGPIAETLTDAALSRCFGLPLHVEHAAGRVFVRSAR